MGSGLVRARVRAGAKARAGVRARFRPKAAGLGSRLRGEPCSLHTSSRSKSPAFCATTWLGLGSELGSGLGLGLGL